MTINTATKPDRAEINSKNAQRSTGPRSPEGKCRSKFNAVKHGMTARTLVLPGEDAGALQARLEDWTADLQPQNGVEQFLVEQAVHSSWKLERADRAEAARLSQVIESVPQEEANRQQDVVAALGDWLLSDRDVIHDLTLRRDLLDILAPDQKRTYPDCRTLDIFNHPEAIVRRLEATAIGCQWLLDRWTELRATLDLDCPWGLAEKARALRLLGKCPLNLEPGKWEVYIQSRDDAEAETLDDLVDRQLDSQLDERLTVTKPETPAVFRGIVDQAIARLETLVAGHHGGAESDAQQAARLSFDASNDAERLRRYQFSAGRALFRSLDTLIKVRRSGLGVESASVSDGPRCTIEPSDEGNPQNEPIVPQVVEEDPQNEPTEPPSVDANPQDESREPRVVDGNPQDEPTAQPVDHTSPPNPPTNPLVDRGNPRTQPIIPTVDRGNRKNEPTDPQFGALHRHGLVYLPAVISAMTLVILFVGPVGDHRGWQADVAASPLDREKRQDQPNRLRNPAERTRALIRPGGADPRHMGWPHVVSR